MTTARTSGNTPPSVVEVCDTGGRLPVFWHRNVTFFANLLSLFFGNEGGTATLREEVGEINSYGGRLAPILNLLFKKPNNLLVLPCEPDASLCAYFRESLGLSLPKLHVMTREEFVKLGEESSVDGADRGDGVHALARHRSQWADGFVTDGTLVEIAKQLGKRTITTEAGSRCGNNKLLLHRYLEEIGLPVVDTCIAESAKDVGRCARELARRGFRSAVVKAQVGASGIGMRKLKNIKQGLSDLAVPEYLFYEGPCLVQGWMEPGHGDVRGIHSPSVQIFISDTSASLYDVTEQILSSASVHEGNESPPAYLHEVPGLREELTRQAGAAARWLHSVGYRGTASADFLVVERDTQRVPEVYVCEINARVTGATYPAVLARNFMPEGAWLHRNLRLREPVSGAAVLAMLGNHGHLYRPGATHGVLPVNFNFGSDGLVHKGQFLCLAETREACHDHLSCAQADAGVEWAVDRD